MVLGTTLTEKLAFTPYEATVPERTYRVKRPWGGVEVRRAAQILTPRTLPQTSVPRIPIDTQDMP